MAEIKTLIEIPDFITVRELADVMETSPIDVIKQLMNNGIMANINQQIDFDTAAIVAEEMGYEAVSSFVEVEEVEEELEGEEGEEGEEEGEKAAPAADASEAPSEES